MSESVKIHKRQFRNIGIADLMHYRFPLSSIVSILHRASGAFMFLLLPAILCLLDKSLLSEISFANFQSITSHWFIKLIILALSWAYLHHFCSGLRHLLLDMDIGLDKDKSRKSAVAVFAVSLVLTVLVALKLFGAF